MSKKKSYTVKSAAEALGLTRQRVSVVVNSLGVGMRLTEHANSPVVLSESDFLAVEKKILELRDARKFKPGNTIQALRKKPGRKKSAQ